MRVEAVYADNAQTQSSRSPVGILTNALKSEPQSNSGEYFYLWDQVKAAAASDSDDKPLLAILSDDTINLFSLVSTDPKEQDLLGISGPTSTLASPLSPIFETFLSPTPNGNGVSAPVRKPTVLSSTPQSPKDWAEFSSAGFGETTISQNFASTLLDKDVEVTEPPVQRKSSKRKQSRSTMASVESNPPSVEPKPAPEEPEGPKLILVTTEIVQLDEAFIDFWRDAIVDPVSSDWPKFVVGELKHPLTPRSLSTSPEDGEKVSPGSPISWIIIEEKLRKPTPPPTPVISHEPLPTSGGLKVASAPLRRTSSPRPSFGEKKSASLSATFKRFTLFSSSKDDLGDDANSVASGSGKKDSISGRKKRSGIGKSPRIGEMGEVFSEEPEPLPGVPEKVEKTEDESGVFATVAKPNAFVPEETKSETLPPAPEFVVSHGETPGPQLALDSTEAGLHHPLDETQPAGVLPVDETEETVDFGVTSHEPTIEHLEAKVKVSAADVGVDLDPVPIVPNDPVEAIEVEEPEPLPIEPADVPPTFQPEEVPGVGNPLDGEWIFFSLYFPPLISHSTVPQPKDAESHPPTEGKVNRLG